MTLYRTARAIPGAVADPAQLAPDAVRAIWMQPEGSRFLPSVIFTDGTDAPLACAMDVLPARQFCQRIAAAHDWPVVDDRPTWTGPEIAAEQRFDALPAKFKVQEAGETLVSMEGVGHLAADMCREYRLPLGLAIHRVSERIGSLIADAIEAGAMTEEGGRKALDEATTGARDRLAQLYIGEGEGPDAARITPAALGTALADYHHGKGSTDAQFQHGLGAAMEAAFGVWTKAGATDAVKKARGDAAIDAALGRWFRLTGKTP